MIMIMMIMMIIMIMMIMMIMMNVSASVNINMFSHSGGNGADSNR